MGFKIGFFDIEATSLHANRGHLLCAALKIAGERKPYIYRLDENLVVTEHWNDKNLCDVIADGLSGLDLIVTQYGSRYDIPFFNSRMLFHGYKPIPAKMHVDVWRISRSRLALSSNRLESVSRFFKTKENKDHLDWETWERAAYGDTPALDAIVDHCRRDVLVLEEVFDTLKPFIKQIRS